MKEGILIVGAGGHGKVVADILIASGRSVMGFLDDDPTTHGGERLGLPVLGSIDAYPHYAPEGLIVAVGDNAARRAIVERLAADAPADLWVNAIHPSAVVAASVTLGRGIVVGAGAIISPDTTIGDYTIINTTATVGHDANIGMYTHVAPGTHLAGSVAIDTGAFVGIGASVIQGCKIGAWATVGAGAVVVRDIPDAVTAVGVPARWT